VIACVAPTLMHAAETMSTLQFADRANSVMLRVCTCFYRFDREENNLGTKFVHVFHLLDIITIFVPFLIILKFLNFI
jgi:hypothetical protein